jgi:1-acyl-sn-glycerol-3-phosphate acyltransferase
MTLKTDFVNYTLRFLTGVACRVDGSQLVKIPNRGPLILAGNHVNFLEVPLLLTRIYPRPVTGLAKVETWKNPFFRFLFNTWGGIPIRRGEADLEAFQKAQAVLKSGFLLAMAPEGTRSYSGKLQKGYPGIVLLALRSEAPILPVVHYGGENFWQNFRRLRRTDFNIRVGNPFHIDTQGQSLSREVRQQITDEIMYQMAALLPPYYRGLYSDLSKASEEYLSFDPGVESNLKQSIPTEVGSNEPTGG